MLVLTFDAMVRTNLLRSTDPPPPPEGVAPDVTRNGTTPRSRAQTDAGDGSLDSPQSSGGARFPAKFRVLVSARFQLCEDTRPCKMHTV